MQLYKKLGISLGLIGSLIADKAIADYIPFNQVMDYKFSLARDYNKDGVLSIDELVKYKSSVPNGTYFATNNIFDAHKEADRIKIPNVQTLVTRLKENKTDFKRVLIATPRVEELVWTIVKNFENGKISRYGPSIEDNPEYISASKRFEEAMKVYNQDPSTKNTNLLFNARDKISSIRKEHSRTSSIGKNLFNGVTDTINYIQKNRVSIEEMISDLKVQNGILIGENHKLNKVHGKTELEIMEMLYNENPNLIFGYEGFNIGLEEDYDKAFSSKNFDFNKFKEDLNYPNHFILRKPDLIKFLHNNKNIKITPTEANPTSPNLEVRDLITSQLISNAMKLNQVYNIMGAYHSQVDRVPMFLRNSGAKIKTVQLDFPERVSEITQELFPGERVIIRTQLGYHISHPRVQN